MCGITGWVAFDGDLTSSVPIIEAMTASLGARGPDAGGTWVRANVALGHRRLAVIDLPGGVQPMEARTPSGAVVLTFSGEVYNFADLRAELAGRGHSFTTRSDTEVVLRGYLEEGYPLVFLSWVLANPELVTRVLDGVAGLHDSTLLLYLVAAPETLEARCLRQPERVRPLDYTLAKLQQIEALPHPKIDTTRLAPEEVAARIVALVQQSGA